MTELRCGTCGELEPEKWRISADELPEMDTTVLVWLDGRFYLGYREYWYDMDNECDSWAWYISSWHRNPLVKYWKPLIPPVTDETS